MKNILVLAILLTLACSFPKSSSIPRVDYAAKIGDPESPEMIDQGKYFQIHLLAGFFNRNLKFYCNGILVTEKHCPPNNWGTSGTIAFRVNSNHFDLTVFDTASKKYWTMPIKTGKGFVSLNLHDEILGVTYVFAEL